MFGCLKHDQALVHYECYFWFQRYKLKHFFFLSSSDDEVMALNPLTITMSTFFRVQKEIKRRSTPWLQTNVTKNNKKLNADQFLDYKQPGR